MELQLIPALIITIIAIVFSGLFSGSEIAFVQSSKVRMEIATARGGAINKMLRVFYHHEDMFISTLLVGNNIVLVIYGIAISVIINPWLKQLTSSDAAVLVLNTVISTLIILFTGEFLPKITFRINPNFTMRMLALPLFLIYLILYPVSVLISKLSALLMRMAGIKTRNTSTPHITMDQIDSLIQQTMDRDDPDTPEVENEVKIFRNAIDFKDTQIGECMIPRNEIVAVNIDTTSRADLVKEFTQTGLSKIVVYRHDIDDVVGYIHVSELFDVQADWRKSIKPVIFTPETMLANKMMRRMLAEKRSLVIIVDEFGGVSGLVTLEDLVEEICGEFEDEHDKKRLRAAQTAPDTYEVSGRVEIEQLNDLFNLRIPESDQYNTLAGYILHHLEALPKPNDTFQIQDLQFTILRMTATKIKLIKIRKIDE